MNSSINGTLTPNSVELARKQAVKTPSVQFSGADDEQDSKKNAENPAGQPYDKAHRDAVDKGMYSYKDPQTGYNVWTELYLKARGTCCKSGCRHCPYGFKKP